MSKAIYTGVNNVARKVKQPYVENNLVARKAKSGWVGVANVARQFFQSKSIMFRFEEWLPNSGYGTQIARQEGTSLYLEASGYAPRGAYISSYYILKDANGFNAPIKAGTTIVLSVRTAYNTSAHTILFRGWKNEKSTTFYSKPNLTDATYTFTSDYDSIEFVVEVGNGGSSDNYAKLWIDRFEINGEKIV